ncbi:hypothetical protein M0802_007574 [Mischocyttarus mexicanus]|nr:hypothetical protein M0802_007574 [Mischocyttarus mexicanus]
MYEQKLLGIINGRDSQCPRLKIHYDKDARGLKNIARTRTRKIARTTTMTTTTTDQDDVSLIEKTRKSENPQRYSGL